MTFPITIIALQLTSTQFSPRVLRNFMRDRASQSVFATFRATFIYALAVLGSVRTGTDGEVPFVPTIAIGGALALTLLSIAMLTFFIHHIAHTIQVSAITESVIRETLAALRREWPEERPEAGNGVLPMDPNATVLPGRQGGYLSYAAHPRLVQLAAKADGRLRFHLAPGQWLSEGRPLLSVAPASAAERLSGDPRDEIRLSAQPTLQQDPSFGVRQLADVGIKALSPSLNDPSTAVNRVHRLTEILLVAGRRHEPPAATETTAGPSDFSRRSTTLTTSSDWRSISWARSERSGCT